MWIISTFLPLVKDLLAPWCLRKYLVSKNFLWHHCGRWPPSLILTSKFYPGYYLIPHPPMGRKSILKFYLALVLLVVEAFLAYFGLIRTSEWLKGQTAWAQILVPSFVNPCKYWICYIIFLSLRLLINKRENNVFHLWFLCRLNEQFMWGTPRGAWQIRRV